MKAQIISAKAFMNEQSSVVSATPDAGSVFVASFGVVSPGKKKEHFQKAIVINLAHMNLSSHVVI